jgi:hypothetical protein
MRQLSTANTTWLFISSSEEERHLLDIVFGYQTLISIGGDFQERCHSLAAFQAA